ncbi:MULTISPECIES: hypothetical protein [unclassified Mesorhizobium]|uniref:hypothetical protein n=1 Tax=unclassified Mesorhizobium TaxID=325217 RepID=UPI000BB04B07|nr:MULTISPECIES: hypothetical protein [unclassified Mesorhizobium]PBB29763.1 hypothetical protein CK214_23610 [Mesorhizobium sp. WSM3882]TIQ93949.1 MAG: hypothetical protein E5X36_28155 [Mesorhizobium sp.]
MNLEIEALRQSAPKLHGRDAEFAASLLHQYDSRSSLSERQWPWVATLTQRAQAGEPAAPKAKVGSMDGLIALFDTAIANKLKHPKIRFDVNGETVVLCRVSAPLTSARSTYRRRDPSRAATGTAASTARASSPARAGRPVLTVWRPLSPLWPRTPRRPARRTASAPATAVSARPS